MQGLGPLEAGGLTGGVTDGLGGPSFGSPSVGGGVPLDGGGPASFPFEFGGPSVGKPAVGSPFAGSAIFINFLPRVFLETGLSSRDAKRFHWWAALQDRFPVYSIKCVYLWPVSCLINSRQPAV